MKSVMGKMKIAIIITLIVLVAGMAILGVFGLNNTVDYKAGYELQVSVDQSIDEAKTILKTSSDAFLSEKGIKSAKYAYQELDDGRVLVYKFNKDVTNDVTGMKDYINAALDANEVAKGAEPKVVVNEVIGNKDGQIGWIILALGITLAVAFIYTLIMEKLASAVAVVCSAIISALTFVALTALTRIPVANFFGAFLGLSFALALALSVATVNKYKQAIKESGKDKVSYRAIADKVGASDVKKYLLTLVAVLIAGVAVSAFFVPYMMIIGGQLAIAGVAAVFSAYFTTPLIWTAIKKDK
ncbi:MAG: hypothetical protein IKA11_02105 [Clostridia bacterium]|nr:hypothetical protein [Clostridia bacterium]